MCSHPDGIKDEFLDRLSVLPCELKCRILSFLPPDLIVELKLSNKEAWMIYNSTKLISLPWNKDLDWVSKLTDVTLSVSNSLFVFTLSDLHRHVGPVNIDGKKLVPGLNVKKPTRPTGRHSCFCFDVAEGTTFKLIPMPQYGGFVWKDTGCADVPWSDLAYISTKKGKIKKVLLSNRFIPKSSSVYAFLERNQLAHDGYVQRYFNRWRDEDLDDEVDDHMLDCSDCEWESSSDSDGDGSDGSYSPLNNDENNCSLDFSEDEEENLEDLRSHLDDLKRDLLELETEWRKEQTGELRRSAIIKQIQECGYLDEENVGKKTVYCHNLNNYGACSLRENCRFLHQIAPECYYDRKCTRVKCGYYHTKDIHPSRKLTREAAIKELSDKLAMVEPAVRIAEEKRKNAEADCSPLGLSGSDICEIGDMSIEDSTSASFVDQEQEKEVADCSASSNDADGVPTDVEMLMLPGKISDDIEIDIDDEHMSDLSDTEFDEEDMQWYNFAMDFVNRPRHQFLKDVRLEREERKEKRLAAKRDRYLMIHEENYPFPPHWEYGVPDRNDFPVKFFLSQHPDDVDDINLLNRRKLSNCFVWNVYDSFKECSLGIAVMSIESCHRPNISFENSFDSYDYPPNSTCVFGSSKLLSVGDFHSNNLPISYQTYGSLFRRPGYFKSHERIGSNEIIGDKNGTDESDEGDSDEDTDETSDEDCDSDLSEWYDENWQTYDH